MALFAQNDRNYQTANNFFKYLNQPLLTTNFIVNEAITLTRCKLSHTLAVEIAHKLYAERIARLFRITPEEEKAALKLFEKYADKTFSFTDCTSFVVMQNLGITQAFTFDKHFQQMGFNQFP